MPTATYHGPQPRLKITATGTRLSRGAETTVTHREAALLAASSADVTVEGRMDFTALTVPELKRLAREVGVSTDGRKADLIGRLEDTDIGAAPDGTI